LFLELFWGKIFEDGIKIKLTFFSCTFPYFSKFFKAKLKSEERKNKNFLIQNINLVSCSFNMLRITTLVSTQFVLQTEIHGNIDRRGCCRCMSISPKTISPKPISPKPISPNIRFA
jgi:hypothetical protein